jgi:hypothetical protein
MHLELTSDLSVSTTTTGEETSSTSLEELSSSDSSATPRLPLNVNAGYNRQISEECNSGYASGRQGVFDNQGLDGGLGEGGARGGADGGQGTAYGNSSGNPQYGNMRQGGYGNSRGAGDAYNSASGAVNGSDKTRSSLDHLKKLSELPSHYKPGNKYTTIVAEQQIDDPNSGRNGRGGVKREKGETSQRSCQFAGASGNFTVSISSSSSSSRSVIFSLPEMYNLYLSKCHLKEGIS